MAKYGLGRGLGALIPESISGQQLDQQHDQQVNPQTDQQPGQRPQQQATTAGADATATTATATTTTGTTVSGTTVTNIPTDLLVPNPDQPRKRIDEASIAELAASIKRHGVIQPLIVEAAGADRYRIVAGERRWRAACIAGLSRVPAIVREFDRDRRLEVALVENIQREDLNPVDEAEAYRQLMEVTGLTQEQVAERVGKSRPAVANALRLLNLPTDAMEAIRAGSISAGHARAILAAPVPADRSAILRRILDDGISVREAETLASDLNRAGQPTSGGSPTSRKPPPKTTSEALDPNLAAIEQDLIGTLGTKVLIRGNTQRGTITIDYFSMDDLDRLYGIITGR